MTQIIHSVKNIFIKKNIKILVLRLRLYKNYSEIWYTVAGKRLFFLNVRFCTDVRQYTVHRI